LNIAKWGDASGSRFCKGNIDELKIWNRALSQSELQKYIYKMASLDDTSLALYLNFNHGIPNQDNGSGCPNSSPCVDYSIDQVGGNNGVLNNFSLFGNNSNWVKGALLPTVSWITEEGNAMSSTNTLTGLQGSGTENNRYLSGGYSSQKLLENLDGYIEYRFTSIEDMKQIFMFGLSETSNNQGYEEIMYGIGLQQLAQDGTMQMNIFENGVSKFVRKVYLGDIIRIHRSNNGEIIYEWEHEGESTILSGQNLIQSINNNVLIVDASLYRYGFYIKNLFVSENWR